MGQIRVIETKTVNGVTYYKVNDGHFLSSGWITAATLAELRRKAAKRKKH